ncbi:ABC transporter permease [Lapidilactobacillus bayanensis]|uniref:ABC transporter permease n=1 Tax=Lapidilactobacillus bayanensis TaxID=2485998 RepID=UPI000F7A7359|nr:ABC transporter permease [Lapidilactobacillus bayanensis]
MKVMWYFTHKEILEAWRKHHLLIIGLIFMIFGIESPLIAKILPDILHSSFGSNLVINIPQPTSVDSWQQFYKNITQMGIYVLAIIFSGFMSQEVSQGTLVNLIAKGLPRFIVVLAKFLVAYLQWCGAILLAFVITWGYTAYYFPDNKSPQPLLGLVPLLIFGLFFTALLLLGSTLAVNNYFGFLFAAGSIIALTILNMWKSVQRWNPVALMTDNLRLVQGTEKLAHISPALMLTLGLTIVLVTLTIIIFNHKRL